MSRLRIFMLALLAAPLVAYGQAYPNRPIKMVVPYPPGGSTDPLARIVAQKMSDSMGQQIIVENRPGAGGALGSALVARAAPDGYTFLLGSNATNVIAKFLSKNLSYDPDKDFTPITAAVETPMALAVHVSVPVQSGAELVDYARKNPGKVSFGSAGNGTPHQLAGELFKQVTGIDMAHVPYKGAGPAIQDLAAGQIPVAVVALATALPHARSGKIRILGVVEPKRSKVAPDVPTVGESVPGFAVPASWFGFFGPAGLPEPVLRRLNLEIVKALNTPDAHAKLESAGLPVLGTSPEELADMIKRDLEVFRKIITAGGIRPE